MSSKATPTRGRRAGRTQKRQERSIETEPLRNLDEEVERPLDAEDIALASLEAKVRAREMRADLGSTGPDAVVAVHLSHTVVSRLEAEAKRRGITPAELIKRALMQYLGI